MSQNKLKIDYETILITAAVILAAIKIAVVILWLKRARKSSSDVEADDTEVQTEVIEAINIDTNVPSPNSIDETEIETEIIEETEIDIDPNAPPPDYDEIEFVSTAVPKQNVDQISLNGLPAYGDIYKDSFC